MFIGYSKSICLSISVNTIFIIFFSMEKTKQALSSIPLLKTKAGPRDVDLWPQRLKEEYQSLIQVSVMGNIDYCVLKLIQNKFGKINVVK